MKKITNLQLMKTAMPWQAIKVWSLLMLTLLNLACQKSTDSELSSDAIVYIKGAENLQSHAVEPWKDGNTLTLSFSGAYTSIEDLFKQAPSDIDLRFSVDLAKVETYNNENGTNYVPLPVGSLNATSFSSKIEKNSQETPELSLTVDVTDGISPFTEYLLPITIEQAGNDTKIDERKKTIYFHVFVMSNAPVEIKVGILTHVSANDNLQQIADIVNPEAPDILVVREIDRNTTRSDNRDMPAILTQMLHNMTNHRFAIQQVFQGGEHGLAIFSRYPITNFTAHTLPYPGSVTRPMGIAELNVNGQTLKIAAANFDFVAAAQPANATAAVQYIGDAEIPPTIFLGTFWQNPNASPLTPVYQILHDAGFVRPCEVCPPTQGHPVPTTWTDMIVYKPERRFDVLEHKVLSSSVSNTAHKPVFTTFDVYFMGDKTE